MIGLDTLLIEVPGIGAKFGAKLNALGLQAVRDLLGYFPYRFEDFSNPTPIHDLRTGQAGVIAATVRSATNERTPRRRMTITKAELQDGSGTITAVWFNQPFLLKQLVPGSAWFFAGKISFDRSQGKVFQVSAFERSSNLFAVYHETEGLSSKWIRHFVGMVLGAVSLIRETLPEKLVAERRLLPLSQAVSLIHKPPSRAVLAEARKRLAIEELLPIMLRNMAVRAALAKEQAPAIAHDDELLRQFTASLPFRLTDDQRKAAWQIITDLRRSLPMNRLLQGEVGSGKTVVAAMAVLTVAKAGYQSLWLAPTEILANQHHHNVKQLLKPFGISVGLWTAGTKTTLDADLVIGTHALLAEGLEFRKLALVIVDEQHRFGVRQRAQLRSGGTTSKPADQQTSRPVPHFLSMTATPIPRTLFLTIWGDLDVTVIEQLPEQRKPVITKVVDALKRDEAYRFVREQVQQGRQVFVITPLIDELKSSKAQKLKLFAELERKSAIKEYDKLRKKVFPDLRIGLLHGRLTSKQKNKVMSDFARGKLDLLVSTAVVEVGIDVPNATVMMIEGAERFGLAQLHQLRGRVGRGEHQSYCLLLPESDDALEHRRLQAMVNTTSGLRLAEYDLQFRGPGELIGTRQHGVPDFKMVSLADSRLIEEAQRIAQEVFAYGLDRLPELGAKLEAFEKVEHLE